MLKLEDVAFGVIARDRVTGAKGTVTTKCERDNGQHSVAVEGADSTGRAYIEWITLDRLELVAL
jgi:hypothetical protein